MPENLSLFLDPAPRTEEAQVKKLSKDSILSLYGSTPSLHASSMAPHGQPLTPTPPACTLMDQLTPFSSG